MSKEKQCECCHEWWYGSDVKEDLCPNCYYYFKQIKQQLAEKDKEIKKLNWQLKDKDFIIKNLNHSLSVAPNANAGQRARIDELTKIVKEKDKEIEKLKLKLDIRAMSLQNINTERIESERNQTQLAIQELAEVERLLYESHYKEIDNRYYAVYEDIKNLIDSRIQALEELRGEKDVKD